MFNALVTRLIIAAPTPTPKPKPGSGDFKFKEPKADSSLWGNLGDKVSELMNAAAYGILFATIAGALYGIGSLVFGSMSSKPSMVNRGLKAIGLSAVAIILLGNFTDVFQSLYDSN